MSNYQISDDDKQFKLDFESCTVAPSDFTHRSHLRIAYIYLCETDPENAYLAMRDSLQKFLFHHGIDPAKYHETLTRAWMMAVHHFMVKSMATTSAAEFIENNPLLLDPNIMLSHYSKEKLFTESARKNFVEPDLEPIPKG